MTITTRLSTALWTINPQHVYSSKSSNIISIELARETCGANIIIRQNYSSKLIQCRSFLGFTPKIEGGTKIRCCPPPNPLFGYNTSDAYMYALCFYLMKPLPGSYSCMVVYDTIILNLIHNYFVFKDKY